VVAAAVVAVPVHSAVKQALLLAGVAPTAQQLLHAAANMPVEDLEGWMQPHNSNWEVTCPLMKAVCSNSQVCHLSHALHWASGGLLCVFMNRPTIAREKQALLQQLLKSNATTCYRTDVCIQGIQASTF
jgi:hypothetical protein